MENTDPTIERANRQIRTSRERVACGLEVLGVPADCEELAAYRATGEGFEACLAMVTSSRRE